MKRADGSWQRMVYDAAGRLVKVQDDSGATQIIHTYGASNHRLIEQVGDESSNQRTYYAWAGDSVIAEYSESAANPTTPQWSKSYIYLGNRLLATIAPSGGGERIEYQHPDRLGTRLVTNNQDTSFIEQVTLPFGTALDAESSGATKRRFTSYDRSSVTGLDYAVNRHYDPLQGRFTQVDPIGMAAASLGDPQTLNLYAYCGNDPINRLDPDGLGFFSFLGKVFSFFAKIAKWVAIVVAVAVLVAVAFPAFAPILGTVLFSTGIWQLGAGVSASFLTGGVAAGISLGATSYVLAGLAAAGAVNSFLAQQNLQGGNPQSPGEIKRGFYQDFQAKLNGCIKRVFGRDARKIPEQTLENAPQLNTSRTMRQLGAKYGPGHRASATSDSRRGPYGIIYISREIVFSNGPNTLNAIYGSYTHELGNLLDIRILNGYGYTHGNRRDKFDKDTGAALERCVFGALQYPNSTVP